MTPEQVRNSSLTRRVLSDVRPLETLNGFTVMADAAVSVHRLERLKKFFGHLFEGAANYELVDGIVKVVTTSPEDYAPVCAGLSETDQRNALLNDWYALLGLALERDIRLDYANLKDRIAQQDWRAGYFSELARMHFGQACSDAKNFGGRQCVSDLRSVVLGTYAEVEGLQE